MAMDWSSLASTAEEERDLFEMANLYPRTTGLPVTVWVSPRGGARHDARVKVSSIPGDRMDLEGATTVSIRPTPTVIHGVLAADVERAVVIWTRLNEAALIDYWDGRLDTVELVARLVRFAD